MDMIMYIMYNIYNVIIFDNQLVLWSNIMDQSEWKKSGKFHGKYEWYNKARKFQRSFQYNSDYNATVIHHLRDTEEQRKYNDEHYELWGHNLDGTFEYGKYVVFVTKEEHAEIHKCSDETKKKISESIKLAMDDHSIRARIIKAHKGISLSKEHKQKISNSSKGKRTGENNPMYGKHLSEEHKKKISESEKGKTISEETKVKQRESKLGEKNPMYGKSLSDSHKQAIHDKLVGRKKSEEASKNSRMAIREMSAKYFEYKSNGGTLGWNEFKHFLKEQKKNVKS